MDIASLDIKIDSTSAKSAVANLNAVASAGAKAETQLKGIEKQSKQTATALDGINSDAKAAAASLAKIIAAASAPAIAKPPAAAKPSVAPAEAKAVAQGTQGDTANVAHGTGELFKNSVKSLDDALKSFGQTGKLSLSRLPDAILADVVRNIMTEVLGLPSPPEATQQASQPQTPKPGQPPAGTVNAASSAATGKPQDKAANVARNMDELIKNSVKSMDDALTSFAQTGKLSFSKLADSIIADFLRMELNVAASNASGGLSGILGGVIGSITGGVSGDTAASLANVAGGSDPIGFMARAMNLIDQPQTPLQTGQPLAAQQDNPPLANAPQALDDFKKSAAEAATGTEDLFTGAFKSMDNSLASFAQTGKLNFSSLVDSIIANFLRMQLEAMTSSSSGGLLGSLLNFGLGLLGGGASTGTAAGASATSVGDYSFGNISSGLGLTAPRAIGGPVSRSSLYRVNERGPELLNIAGNQYLMTGSQGGSITPNDGGGTPQVVIENHGADIQQRTDAQGRLRLAIRAEFDDYGLKSVGNAARNPSSPVAKGIAGGFNVTTKR